jgi:hypothetical protein
MGLDSRPLTCEIVAGAYAVGPTWRKSRVNQGIVGILDPLAVRPYPPVSDLLGVRLGVRFACL